MLKVGIVGGTGYAGVELLRILARHPEAQLTAITSRKEAGMPVAELFPSLRRSVDLRFADPAGADLSRCDVVFFATPHGVAMEQGPRLVEAGVRLTDLAADFRLKDLVEWQKWYNMTHSCPRLAEEAAHLRPVRVRADEQEPVPTSFTFTGPSISISSFLRPGSSTITVNWSLS